MLDIMYCVGAIVSKNRGQTINRGICRITFLHNPCNPPLYFSRGDSGHFSTFSLIIKTVVAFGG